MVSGRQPDQAIYLDPEPYGHKVWTKWVAHIVVEVVSPGGEQRDFVDKHEEYLRVGVAQISWILDTEHRRMHALVREGDTWEETIGPESGSPTPCSSPACKSGPLRYCELQEGKRGHHWIAFSDP